MTELRILIKKVPPGPCGQCGSEKHEEEKCKGIAPIKCPECGDKISVWERKTVAGKKGPEEVIVAECKGCGGEG